MVALSNDGYLSLFRDSFLVYASPNPINVISVEGDLSIGMCFVLLLYGEISML